MIRTHDLTKDFTPKRSDTVHAVKGVTLTVEPGELVAVLGPNGAGKTTTMRMLTTLIKPTSGTAEVAGFDVVTDPDEVRRRIGYVGQGNGAGHTQRVLDELSTQGVIYGLDRHAARRRAGELLEALDLTSLARRKVSDLSGGQRRRLDVAMGLVHAPSLLFLDEPSTGLDPHNRANLWDHIMRMRDEYEMTIMLTTHYLDEADSMAERVVIIDYGEVIADDTAENLKTNHAGDRIVVGAASTEAARRLAEIAGRLPGAREIELLEGASGLGRNTPPRVAFRVDHGPRVLPELLRAAHAAGTEVTTAELSRPTLDDVFLNLTGRSLRETAVDAGTGTTAEGPAGPETTRKDAA